MIALTIGELAAAIDATPDPAAAAIEDVVVTAVVTDSREAVPGCVFVARRGETADGADHAPAAVRAGAEVVVAERPLDVPTLVVGDADAALAAIATLVRARASATVIAITGSVGKTTTKDLTAAAVGASRRVVAATGSYNNEVGVPLTVCRLDEDTEVLVTELGARGGGQIARLAAWLRPDVAVVSRVAGVHLELFGTVDEVARAKSELVAALGPTGTAVLNADDPRVAAMATLADGRVLTVSAEGDTAADLWARDVRLDERARASFVAVTPWGDLDVSLPITGAHHVGNALLALAAAVVAGADPHAAAAALRHAQVSTGRARVVELDAVTVVDDSYNANPTSTVAALRSLGDMAVAGRRLGVLGVMAEIGADHEAEHRRVGGEAALVLDALVVVGDAAAGIAEGARAAGLAEVELVADAHAALAALDPRPGDAVLVKASRVAGLEGVVAGLEQGQHA